VLAPVPDETDESERPILMRSYTAQDLHDFEPFVEIDIDLNPERVVVGHHSASHLCAAARVTTRWRRQNDTALPVRREEESVEPRWAIERLVVSPIPSSEEACALVSRALRDEAAGAAVLAASPRW